MRLLPRNPWLALPVGWALFFALSSLVKVAGQAFSAGPPWRSQAILKCALLALSLVAARVEGLRRGDLGFQRAREAPWAKAIAGGLLLGMAATLAILLSGSPGLRALTKGYSFGALVAWIWIGSSVSEEVFCRGWFQSSIMRAQRTDGVAAILPSAVLFGGLHASLIFAGVGAATVAILVVATTVLGLLAARVRARSKSLYPAIAAHVAFNVGGLVGGVAYVVARRLVSGHLPGPP